MLNLTFRCGACPGDLCDYLDASSSLWFHFLGKRLTLPFCTDLAVLQNSDIIRLKSCLSKKLQQKQRERFELSQSGPQILHKCVHCNYIKTEQKFSKNRQNVVYRLLFVLKIFLILVIESIVKLLHANLGTACIYFLQTSRKKKTQFSRNYIFWGYLPFIPTFLY